MNEVSHLPRSLARRENQSTEQVSSWLRNQEFLQISVNLMRWLLSMIGLSYHKAVGVLQSLQTGMHTYAALIVLFCDFPFYDNTPLYTLWDGFGPTWINFGICTTEEQNRTRIWGRRIRITFWVFKHAHDRQK